MKGRFVIEVVDPDGDVMYVRNGLEPGVGPITLFTTRKEAQDQVTFMKMGLEEGDDYESISILPWRKDLPKEDVEGGG